MTRACSMLNKDYRLCQKVPSVKTKVRKDFFAGCVSFNPIFCGLEQDQGSRARGRREGGMGQRGKQGGGQCMPMLSGIALSAFSVDIFELMSCSVKISLCRWNFLVQVKSLPLMEGGLRFASFLFCAKHFIILEKKKSSQSVSFQHNIPSVRVQRKHFHTLIITL